MFRIKTLAEIGDQRDRLVDYLTAKGRYDSADKIDDLYYCIFGRVLNMLGVEKLDDETLEWVCEEPLIVGLDY
ncbi:MAG: hypothetical protein NC418_06215 [Muribaculaceae bacterium]|nr:hypothetical protein [Muribaculaceae bacterium]